MSVNIISIEPSINEIMNSVRKIAEVIGGDWVMKKMKKEKKEIEKLRISSKNRKHAYLYKPIPHPLISWALDFEKWQAACIESGKFEVNESVLRLHALGNNLEKTRYQSGFEKLVQRLKDSNSFFSAAFEVEVAAIYSNQNYSVQFIEEGAERTPDLRITRNDGSYFFVECKSRDLLTERDARISAFWLQLQANLVREIGPKKENVAIFVKSLRDPDRADMAQLQEFIVSAINSGGVGSIDNSDGGLGYVQDPSENYHVIVLRLGGPDEEVEGERFGFVTSENFHQVLLHCEIRSAENNRTLWKNPFIIGMRNEVPTDKITGILHSLKSAVGQLPKDSPGIVWIRVPDNLWNENLDDAMKKAEELLKRNLTGDMNRSVNAVTLLTKFMHVAKKDEMNGLVYAPAILHVEHDNPRHVMA